MSGLISQIIHPMDYPRTLDGKQCGSSMPGRIEQPSTEPMNRYPKRKRAEVKYFDSDSDSDSICTDSEEESIPIRKHAPLKKRPRTNTSSKPLPERKIFPFLSLPAELRNRIYEECLLDLDPRLDDDSDAIFLRAKQKAYRRGVERFFPEEPDYQAWGQWNRYPVFTWHRRRTARGRRGKQFNRNVQEDVDEEDERPTPRPLALGILAVCKQIYDEAAPMMYTRRLVFADTTALISFAAQLSPRTAALLRHIEVRCYNLTRSRKQSGSMAMILLAAKGVTNLEKLHINCSIGHFHSWSWRDKNKVHPIPKRIARKVYRDFYLWLEAVGAKEMLGEGDVYKGVDVLELGESNFEEYLARQGVLRNFGGQSRSEDAEDKAREGVRLYKKELRRLLRQAL